MENNKIQVIFNALEIPHTFQGRFNFQRLFKKALYIHILFKPVLILQMDPDFAFIWDGKDWSPENIVDNWSLSELKLQ